MARTEYQESLETLNSDVLRVGEVVTERSRQSQRAMAH